MLTGLTKKEIKEYQNQINEARQKLNYAKCFTPHKVGYYQSILLGLINNAPVQCI